MIDEIAQLFRPRIHARKGKWIHLNTIAVEYPFNLGELFDLLDINGIVYTHQEPRDLSRIYLDEEWVKLILSGEMLAKYCLLQSQVKDDELSPGHLQAERARQPFSPRKASQKQIRFINRLMKSKSLNPREVKMLDSVFLEGWITKERAKSIIDHMIGLSRILPDGGRVNDSAGIVTHRERQSRLKSIS